MSLLDVDEIDKEVLLNTLIKLYRDKRGTIVKNFVLKFEHNIDRIRRPDLYEIYYDFETVKPGTIYDEDNNVTVSFHIFKRYNSESIYYYTLGKTLEEVYESIG